MSDPLDLNPDEQRIVEEYSESTVMHNMALAEIPVREKLGYFNRTLERIQAKEGVVATSVPFRAFLWLLLKSGVLDEADLAGCLLDMAGFPRKGGLVDKDGLVEISIGARNKKRQALKDFLPDVQCGKLCVANFERMFKVLEMRLEGDILTLNNRVYRKVIEATPILRALGFAPVYHQEFGESLVMDVGWLRLRPKSLPYMYMHLKVDSLVAMSKLWFNEASTNWLWRKRDTQFALDSGMYVSAAQTLLPLCLAAMETLAGKSLGDTKNRVDMLTSAAIKSKQRVTLAESDRQDAYELKKLMEREEALLKEKKAS